MSENKRRVDEAGDESASDQRRRAIISDLFQKLNHMFVYTHEALKSELFPTREERKSILQQICPKRVTDLHSSVPLIHKRVAVQFNFVPSALPDGTRLLQKLEFEPRPESPLELISGDDRSSELAAERIILHQIRHCGGHNSYPYTLALGLNVCDLARIYLQHFHHNLGTSPENLSLADDVTGAQFTLPGYQPPHDKEELPAFKPDGYLNPNSARLAWLADNSAMLYNGVHRFQMLDPHGGGLKQFCVCSSAHVIAKLATDNWKDYWIRIQRSPGSALNESSISLLEYVVMSCELFERLVGEFVRVHSNRLPWADTNRILCELKRYRWLGCWNDPERDEQPDFNAPVEAQWRLELIYSMFPRQTAAVPLISKENVRPVGTNDHALGQALRSEARKFLSEKELGSTKFF